jgi:hypothetical protein
MDLYRLNDRNYTFTALATSVVSSDALTSQCYAIIINASEPVFIKITPHGEDATSGSGGYFIKDWPHYIRVSPGDRIAGLRAGSSDSVVYITELTK